MKKRTAFIGALMSFLPLGQPLVIGTGAVFTSTALMISVPEKVKAETVQFYIDRGDEKYNNGNEGDYYGAIFDYTKAIEIAPNNLDASYAYSRRGSAKFDLKDFDGAILDQTKSIEIRPDAFNLAFRADAKYELGDHYGAISDYNKAIKLDSQASYPVLMRGVAKEAIGDMKGACSDWRKASSLDNEDAAKWVKEDC